MKLICQNKKLRRVLRVEVLVGLVLAVCASGSILFAQNSQNKREEVLASFNLQKNIVYKKVDGRELSLLLFLPEGEFNVQGKKAPVMLFIRFFVRPLWAPYASC